MLFFALVGTSDENFVNFPLCEKRTLLIKVILLFVFLVPLVCRHPKKFLFHSEVFVGSRFLSTELCVEYISLILDIITPNQLL